MRNPYFFVTFKNFDAKVGKIHPCFKEGYIKIGFSMYPLSSIEVIEFMDDVFAEEVFEIARDPNVPQDIKAKKLKELLELPRDPSFVYALHTEDEFEVYFGYKEKSRLMRH